MTSTAAPPVAPEQFFQVDIRCGVVLEARPFPEARKPSCQLKVDFGEGVGVLQSSAQLTRRYTPEGLVGTQVLGVVNFPPMRIAGFRSECLILGVVNPDDPGDVWLIRPGPDGASAVGAPPIGWRLG